MIDHYKDEIERIHWLDTKELFLIGNRGLLLYYVIVCRRLCIVVVTGNEYRRII